MNISDTKSRYYLYGYETYLHKNVPVTSVVGNKNYDVFVTNLDNKFEYKVGYVPVGYQHRPDLISNLFYDTPGYWWILMQVNNVIDPFDGFNVGDQIRIPILK